MWRGSTARVPYLFLFAPKSGVPLPEKIWFDRQAEAMSAGGTIEHGNKTVADVLVCMLRLQARALGPIEPRVEALRCLPLT